MPRRTGAVVAVALLLTISANAQQPQPPVQTAAAADAQDPDAPKKPDRVFGVLPNYGTVEDATNVPAITTASTFRMAALNAFDPYVFTSIGVTAAFAQVENQETSLGNGPGAYVVRYATSFADGTISSFLTSAIFPTLLKQDPRYFELREGSAWRRAGYAASRTVITRGRSGEGQFNLSGIGGNGVAAALSNLYYPSADHGATQTLARWGTQVMWDAVSNELKEFWPDIRRKMHRK
jgi:hypothetical protein